MRKTGVFVLIAVLAVSMIGCSRKVDVNEPPAPPSSFSAGEASQTPEPSEEPTATAEPETATTSPAPESEQPTATVTEGEKQQGGNQAGGGQVSSDSETSKPSQATTTKPSAETPKPTQQPVATEPQKTDPPATPTPTPTEPPTPKTAYDAPYDTAQIIADAKAYGESIGMTWSAPLTTDNCSWEAPGATSPTLSGERLKTAIEGRIRRIKKIQQDNEYQPGEFHFKVVFESRGGSEYAIYFLMG